jgi:hypothetical protein
LFQQHILIEPPDSSSVARLMVDARIWFRRIHIAEDVSWRMKEKEDVAHGLYCSARRRFF